MKVRHVLLMLAITVVIMALAAACAPAPAPAPTAAPPTAAPAQPTAAPAAPTSAPPPTTAPTTAPPTTAPTAAPKVGTTYKIGFAPGTTGGGSFLGEPEDEVGKILADRFKGGIVGSDGVQHPVQILIKDTQSTPDTGVSVARGFIDQDKVVALVMGSTTPVSLAIAPIAEESKVPYVSMASSSAIITDPKTNKMLPWVFKTPQSNGDVAVWFADRVQKMGAKTAGYLYENTGFGKDVFNNAKAALEKVGVKTVFSDSFERSDTTFPKMAGLKAANPDVVIVGAIPPGAALVTVAIRDTLPNVPILQGHGVCTPDFIKLAGKAAEGVELPCSAVIIAEDVPASDPQKAVFTDFKSTFEKATGKPVSTFGGHAWDALYWVIDALKSLPDGLTLDQQRQQVRDYIETKIVNWPGTAGIFTVTPTDHYGLTPASFTWFKIENGKFVPFPKSQW
jgi:branched-chain amino acid transport system substrate-binding protein